MSRVTVCLFFIAICQHGILKSLADESTTERVSKNIEVTTAKPTEDEPAKEVETPAKVEAEDKTGVTSKTEAKEEVSDVKEKSADKSNEGKVATDDESKKEDDAEKTVNGDNRKSLPDMLKGVGVPGNPLDQTKSLFEFPKHILAPVNAIGAKVHEVVVKGLDSAKGLANGTFSFLRSTINGPFQNK